MFRTALLLFLVVLVYFRKYVNRFRGNPRKNPHYGQKFPPVSIKFSAHIGFTPQIGKLVFAGLLRTPLAPLACEGGGPEGRGEDTALR